MGASTAVHAVAPRLRAAGGGASRTRPDAARRRAGGSGARGTMREERCPRAALTARHGPKPAVRVETHLLESWDHQSRRRTVETDRPNTPGFGEAEPCRLALLTERELSAETPRPGTRDRWHEPHNASISGAPIGASAACTCCAARARGPLPPKRSHQIHGGEHLGFDGRSTGPERSCGPLPESQCRGPDASGRSPPIERGHERGGTACGGAARGPPPDGGVGRGRSPPVGGR